MKETFFKDFFKKSPTAYVNYKILHDNLGIPYGYELLIHKSLVEKALRLKKAYKNGEPKSSAFFSFIVDDIIVGHKLHSDTEYFSYTQNS